MPFRDKLSEIEEDVYQVRNRSGQDPLNFPIKLNNKIAALGSSVQHGDGKPTTASYEVYKLLHDRLLDEQAKLDHLLKQRAPGGQQEPDRSQTGSPGANQNRNAAAQGAGAMNNTSRRRRGAEEYAEEYRFPSVFLRVFLRDSASPR